MGNKNDKTNAMRLLDAHGASYIPHSVEGGSTVACEVAAALGVDARRVFKTLVTTGKSGAHYVFMLPAPSELDLKKAAIAAGEKAIVMLKASELLPLTGYIHGGCSPIGMKKPFPTFIDRAAEGFETIFFSAGKIGRQIETTLCVLREMTGATTADLRVE